MADILTLEEAAEIFGDHFLGLEEAQKVWRDGESYSAGEIAEIQAAWQRKISGSELTVEVLQKLAGDGYWLLLEDDRLMLEGKLRLLNLQGICQKYTQHFASPPDKAWYQWQTFYGAVPPPKRWILQRERVLEESVNKPRHHQEGDSFPPDQTQKAVVEAHAKKLGLAPEKVQDFGSVRDLSYLFVFLKEACEITILEQDLHRTDSLDDNGRSYLTVGETVPDGLSIKPGAYYNKGKQLGVAPRR